MKIYYKMNWLLLIYLITNYNILVWSLTKIYRGRLLMKTVIVFGATGKTGSEVVFQALKSGRNVVALARDPSKMLIPKGSGGDQAGRLFESSKLKVVKGSVTDPLAVRNVFEVNLIHVFIELSQIL
jgi:FlaA1/EpsC-like NDP-sugar epimerase